MARNKNNGLLYFVAHYSCSPPYPPSPALETPVFQLPGVAMSYLSWSPPGSVVPPPLTSLTICLRIKFSKLVEDTSLLQIHEGSLNSVPPALKIGLYYIVV